jgi:hypothetical protein
MSYNYSIYSLAYVEQDVSPYNCYLNEAEWGRITKMNPTVRLFARIKNRDKDWYVALGEPIKSDAYNDKTLFVPSWMLEHISVYGDGESVEVDWIPVDFFENSTHISLKPVNFNYESSTIEEELSIELTKLGILQTGSRIYISMPSLDNYTIIYDVVYLEPANIVLCQGDNVSLEFINDPPREPSVARPPSPYPQVPEVLIPPSVTPSAPPVERYNPWRSKDFKPPFS